MTIFTPNILITRNYRLINRILSEDNLSNLKSEDLDDALVFFGEQNRYVYSLEHSFGVDEAGHVITLKVVDADGKFENQFFNETFFEKLITSRLEKYLKSNRPASEFEGFLKDILVSKLKIYISYGVGDKFSTWSSPMACTLVAANIDVANNGLRTYTYKFTPTANSFFKAVPEADEINRQNDEFFNFADSNFTVSEFIYVRDFNDVRGNLEKLISGFIAKACNTLRSNVIVLLPDINNIIKKNQRQVSFFAENTQEGAPIEAGIVKDLDFSQNKLLYSRIFKSIFVESPENVTVFQFKGLNLKNAKTSIQDFFVEKELETNKKLDVIRKKLYKVEEDKKNEEKFYKILDEKDKKIRNEKKISEIKSDINKINDKLTLNSQGLGLLTEDDEKKLREELKKKTVELITLESQKSGAESTMTGSSSKYAGEKRSAKDIASELSLKLSKGINYGKGLLAGGAKAIADSLIPNSIPSWKIESELERLVIRSDSYMDPHSGGRLINPFPDLKFPLTNIFNGINNLLNGTGHPPIFPMIDFETDLNWLKLFKEWGMISDENSPCIIVGDKQMVLDYIYCNQLKPSDILTKDIKSNYPIDPKDSLFPKLTSKQYKQGIVNIVSKKKTSSSFAEKLYVDELALVTGKQKDFFNSIEDLSEIDDIPIFVSNFRNSNIISYSLKNSENYLSVLDHAIKDNRYQYLYQTQRSRDYAPRLLAKFGITDPNPMQVAERFFKDIFDKLKNLQIDESLITSKIEDKNLELVYSNINDKTFDNKKWKNSSNTNSGSTLASNLSKLNLSSDKLKKYILPNSTNTYSLLSIAMYENILQYPGFQKVNEADIANLIDLIITLNISADNNSNTSMTITPTLNGPGDDFLVRKTLEYAKRFAVEINIKTIPFFHLSNLRTISKRAILFSKQIKLSQDTIKSNLDFFSGQYIITTFKHVISTTECYSEFSLVKDFGTPDDVPTNQTTENPVKQINYRRDSAGGIEIPGID